ncbi:MAG TPA: hypothetical protein VJ400_04015 [Thermoplasmata archaeon]|nr:hypothetical protein [Thermoplasmata archaeon]
MRILERWRAGRPEFVVLAGSVVGFGSNVAGLAWVFLSGSEVQILGSAAVTTAALVLCVLAPLPLRGAHPRTARRFGIAGLAASIIALLTAPGVIGGGIALAGAIWGLLVTEGGGGA